MSYTLVFWIGADDLPPREVYARLGDEQHVDGVVPVDRERVVQAFADTLPDWRWDGQFLQPPGVEPDGAPAYDVHLGAQEVSVVGYGWEPEHFNAIIDAMHTLGYRLYDPQVDERFG